MLQVGVGEVSRWFGVREQSMGKAYTRVRQFLQEALPNYVPKSDTRPFRQQYKPALNNSMPIHGHRMYWHWLESDNTIRRWLRRASLA